MYMDIEYAYKFNELLRVGLTNVIFGLSYLYKLSNITNIHTP